MTVTIQLLLQDVFTTKAQRHRYALVSFVSFVVLALL